MKKYPWSLPMKRKETCKVKVKTNLLLQFSSKCFWFLFIHAYILLDHFLWGLLIKKTPQQVVKNIKKRRKVLFTLLQHKFYIAKECLFLFLLCLFTWCLALLYRFSCSIVVLLFNHVQFDEIVVVVVLNKWIVLYCNKFYGPSSVIDCSFVSLYELLDIAPHFSVG